ncbi:MAG: aldo/keto reductase [Candidatus Promineifilaceae bacterium]|nr:aldo/keto reductase [Candidatus Promineifilaceae bacterium]
MQYRRLGSAGVRVSVIGLGTNQFGGKVGTQGVKRIVARALELGVNFIDTADVYQGGKSEVAIGKALAGRWDEVVLATKVYFRTGDGPNDRGSSRYHIMNGVEASLRRLQSDHIDLYQMHRWDAETPIGETLRALDDLIRQGKIRYIGASAYAAWQLAQANLLAELRGWSQFVTVQSHYHLLQRDVEREVLPYCRVANVGFIPYFPLAGGFLTGKYQADSVPPAGSRGEESNYVQGYMTAQNFARVERLTKWAEDRGHSMVELALAWLAAQSPVSSVIAGVTRLEQLEENVQAAEWRLTSKDLETIDELLEG